MQEEDTQPVRQTVKDVSNRWTGFSTGTWDWDV